MAATINGLIAKENDDISFVSDVEWKFFRNMIKKFGNCIIGRRTWEVSDAFPYPGLNIVMTKRKIENKWGGKVVFTDKSPKEVLQFLQKKGFKTAFVAGGGKLNSSFMKENLIDEVYLDIEPTVFGKGIKLFAEEDFERKLKLIGTKKLSANEIQLHYKVKK
jgi:dihydrofolate reductase